MFLSISLSIYLPIYRPIYLSISLCLPVYLSTCLSASLKTKQVCETSFIFELNNVQNETILRDFFIFRTWQHPKQSNSATLLQFLNMTTSKAKQFGETSFKDGKLSAALTAPATKNWWQVIRSAAPVTQNHLSKPTHLMLQNTSQEISALTS